MNIRTKLTLTFFSLVVVVLTSGSVAIYFFSANYRQEDFTRRLKNRAINTAKVLVEVREVNAELLKRMERNNPASLPNQYVAIFNHRDEELYKSGNDNVLSINSELLRTIRLKKDIKYAIPNYEVVGFVFSDATHQFTVVAAAMDVYGLNALENLRNILIATFCTSLVFVSLMGWFYAGKVLRPISKIVEEVSTITEVNLNLRLDEGNQKDELGMLAKTFNRMLIRLQGAFSLQRSFIANASHEIKTPITAMSGEIEVTLLQEREKEYYVNVLRSVSLGLKALNRMSTQLLMLAQTSAEKQNAGFAAIRIDDIIWEVKEELMKAHQSYKIDINFDLELQHQSMVVDGDSELMKVCFLNLADNGCKYSNDNHVVIDFRVVKEQSITIEFTNTGRGIEPELIDKIFEPFFRSKTYRNVKGFGIGLSLARSIVALHHGTIRATSTPNADTIFTIILPTRKQPDLISF